MKVNLLIILAIFIALLSGTTSLAGELFTWEDAQGNLNVTEERPPDGVEILAIDQVKIKSTDEMRQEVLTRERLRAEELARRRTTAEAEKPVVKEEPVSPSLTDDEKQEANKYKAKQRNKKKRARKYFKAEDRRKAPMR